MKKSHRPECLTLSRGKLFNIFQTWQNVQFLHVKTAPLAREVDVHYRSLTPSSSHLLWMVPTSAVLSLPTSLPFHQRSLRRWPPQPVRWLAWPESLLVHPCPPREVPCCRDSRAAEPACNIGCFPAMWLQGSFVIHDAFASFLSSPFFWWSILDVASACIICPHCHAIFGILNLHRKKPWTSWPWAPFLLLEELVCPSLLFIFF